jgi:insulysin
MSTPQYLAGSGYITRKLKRFDQIIKSNKDKRNYRGLLLDNELKCLLISDSLTERSAASMDVNVGCMLDPKKLPGLAHFLEQYLNNLI